jgi:hypothetical protein
MTDGPFKNLKLSRRWKRFAEAAGNDAVDSAERCALASNALVREILTSDTPLLLTKLRTYTERAQLDLDPLSSVAGIFNDHNRTSFSDALQKELSFRLSDHIASGVAMQQALKAAVTTQIIEAKNHFEEECIRACESGEMRQDQFAHTVNRGGVAFNAVPTNEICNAILAGDKNAFKSGISKKEGLDEGPSL